MGPEAAGSPRPAPGPLSFGKIFVDVFPVCVYTVTGIFPFPLPGRLEGPSWRRIEVVITRTTRNRLIGDEPVRGFESHRLRQICRVKKLSPQKASVFNPYKALSLKSERALHFSYIRGFSPN